MVKQTCPARIISLKIEFACKGMMDERSARGINDWVVKRNFIRGREREKEEREREKDGNNNKKKRTCKENDIIGNDIRSG